MNGAGKQLGVLPRIEADGIASRRWIGHGHAPHLLAALSIDTNRRQGMRYADLRPQGQHPVEKTGKTLVLEADMAGQPRDRLADRRAIRHQHVWHQDGVEQAVVGVVQCPQGVGQRVHGPKAFWKAVAPIIEATSICMRASRSLPSATAAGR